jgi:hypothetical protein
MQVFGLIVHLAQQHADLRLQLLECHDSGFSFCGQRTIDGSGTIFQFGTVLNPSVLVGFC